MSYALRTSSGPVELVPGQAIVSNGVQFSYATMLFWSDAERTAVGIVPIVEPEPAPAGQVETGSTLADDGTAITRVPTLSSVALADAKATAAAAVDARRDAILTGGYSHDFGGTVGVKVLQTATTDDDTNWLTLQNSCIAASIAGQGATIGAVIRTLDNVNVPLSYGDCLQVLLAMSAWGAAVYAASWTLKDAVTAAADLPTLNAIDITRAWPANP